MTINPDKCFFLKDQVKLLGYIVSKQGIKSDQEKVIVINNMIPPNKVEGVRTFLGMKGYNRQCLAGYA